MKNILSVFCLLLVLAENSFSQAEQTGSAFLKKYTVTVKEIKEDLQILKRHLETVQAGLYTYTSKAKMDQVFDDIEASVNQPISSIEFYRKIVPLLQHIKNGHTNIMPHLAYEEAINNSFTLFPFDVYFDKGSLYVLKNNSANPSIKEGSVIKSINGEDASSIFKELAVKSSRDGDNRTFPEMVTTLEFNKLYSKLKDVYPIYKTKFITPKNELLDIPVKGLTLKEIAENKLKRYKDDGKWWGETNNPVLKLKINNDIATMEIRTFSIYYARRVKQKFKRFFNKAFDKIEEANVKHLIIDLRYNGGGDEMPTIELLSHLLDKPFTFYKDMYTITNKVPNMELYDESKFEMNFLYPLFKLKRNGDVYRVKGIPGMKEVQPSKSVYKEKVYVLTNGLSFSATGEFASFLKNADRAMFIGEEVGGNTNQNVSGTTVTLTLPNSKVRIRIPMELFKLNVSHEKTNHGVIPDYYVRPSITDKLTGKDPEMDFVLNMIKKTNK
ncbi:S41 family peptidase [Flavivirga algicola]|uniref:Tail specific protease domain-containing protein n=1 Tax=Flavivirga algicola TaxID=2729136 RepID=A0ABX1S2M0_9FLAO|nr:S41 family peptidase [Flavivirga algicola]NMH88897.1 hypothetical protein [Flavivirga algicola]